MVEHAGDVLIDDVVKVLRTVIERWSHREDRCPGARQALHVLDVDQVQRCLAEAEEQWPPLLESDVCGAVHQVVGHTAGQAPERVIEWFGPPTISTDQLIDRVVSDILETS